MDLRLERVGAEVSKFKVGDKVAWRNGAVKGVGEVVRSQPGTLLPGRVSVRFQDFKGYEDSKDDLDYHTPYEKDLDPVETWKVDVNPSHYDFPGGVQVIDITKHLDFLRGNAVKYLCRAGRKGDAVTDLKKALRYIEWAIEKEESTTE